MKNFYALAAEQLKNGNDICIATIVSQTGSAPREPGSHFIVKADGESLGTIGGGRLEAETTTAALEAIRKKNLVLFPFTMKGEEVASDGMICGGDVEVYLEPVYADDPTAVDFFQSVEQARSSGDPAILATLIRTGPVNQVTERKLLLLASGAAIGAAAEFGPVREELYKRISGASRGAAAGERLRDLPGVEGKDCFLEPVIQRPVVYVFGGGHISLYLSRLITMVGFRLVVLDDRPEFANNERFPNADEVRVVDFNSPLDGFSLSPGAYVIIVTRGHSYDKEILAQVLGKETAYVGMISSRRKRSIIFKTLEEEGIGRDKLDSVYSPIGLDIGAQTPEEIAVSIVAELIAVKAGKR